MARRVLSSTAGGGWFGASSKCRQAKSTCVGGDGFKRKVTVRGGGVGKIGTFVSATVFQGHAHFPRGDFLITSRGNPKFCGRVLKGGDAGDKSGVTRKVKKDRSARGGGVWGGGGVWLGGWGGGGGVGGGGGGD